MRLKNYISLPKLTRIEIRRLPFARLIVLPNIYNSINSKANLTSQTNADVLLNIFGLTLKENTVKIEKIHEHGLFYKNNLKYDTNKVEYDVLEKNYIFDKKYFSS